LAGLRNCKTPRQILGGALTVSKGGDIMFNPLKGLGDLQQMQQQAQKMQQALQQEEVMVEKNGVKVILRGDQLIKEIYIDDVLENRLVDAINEGIKKTQELAAKKLIEISQQG
jgi:DNA-binding protein YbaB